MIVLGGGSTGLSLADALSQTGRAVTVIEAADDFGGLVRTHELGGHLFDTGPHGIYCHDQNVQSWFADLLGDALRPIERRSFTLFRGQAVPYPLTIRGALAALSAWESLRVMVEAGVLRTLRRALPEDASFEDWATRAFGTTLYRLFFERYTEKVWGLPCRELSAAWVSVHLPANSLLQVLVNRLREKNLPIGFVSRFHYSALGSGHLIAQLVARLRTRPEVELLPATRVTRLARVAGRFEVSLAGGTEGERVAADVVSTIPPGVLLGLLEPPPPPPVRDAAQRLRFRNLILVSLVVSRPRVGRANWLYVPDPAVEVARVSEFKNMIASMQDRPDTSLQAEIFCWPNDPVWSAPDDEVVRRAVASLETLGLVRREEVTASRVLRVPHAYPVFDLEFGARMRAIHGYLEGIPGLHLLGRTGAFLYLDQAGCVKQAFDWARTSGAAAQA